MAVIAAGAALAAAVCPAEANAARRRPALLGAHLDARGGARSRVVLRWSEPVRIRHSRRVLFLAATGSRRHGRLLSRRPGRVQTFLARGAEPVQEVQVLAGAGHGRDGATLPATLILSRAPVPAPAPATSAGPLSGGADPPPLAFAFLDSVGVNIHAGYLDTSYGNAGALEHGLVGLGVHHVRDGACVSCSQQRTVLLELARAGITTDFVMNGPGGSESQASMVDLLDGPMNSAVASIEGPNEYDSSSDPNWAANLRSYQQELYRRAKAAPHLVGIPVLGPSLAHPGDAARLGGLSAWLDLGNLHPYPGGHVPDANLAAQEQAETSVAGAKPEAVTETGYTTATASTSDSGVVSDSAGAAYVPRAFLDDFRAGIARTYLYELLDEKPDPADLNPEQHYGLLRADYSHKPAYNTLAALLSAVGPTQAAPITRAALDYRTVAGPSDLRELLLQTGTGTYALVLWRNVSVWDPTLRRNAAPAAEPVTLHFGAQISSATERSLDAPAPGAPDQPDPAGNLTLTLAGMPVVVELRRGPS